MRSLTRNLLDIQSHVDRSGKYALIDYPNYLNPGDSAIWAGTRLALQEKFGQPPGYVSSLRGFDAELCRKAVDDGAVFFLGGGSFGNLYGKHHQRRLSAIEKLGANPIVLLPLSLAERDTPDMEHRRQTADVLASHGNAMVFARENMSRKKLVDHYGIDAVLCPDLAHMLAAPRIVPTRSSIRIYRKDAESLGKNGRHGHSGQDDGKDWSDIARLRLLNKLGKAAFLVPGHGPKLRFLDFLALGKLRLALDLVGSGKMVRTDRLHAMILANLLDRDVIAYDNATGKLGSYLSTWREHLHQVTVQ
ncbi:MAG: polysaccharide pyruvyl transferase family protein [Rhizobiaceae bacterium]|nr:polysaccharide pyruvyl transferase family protein [Rhizobiaceae bacterium]